MRKLIVFYAWQSDTPQEHNHNFIRMALEAAAEVLNKDQELDVEIKIDSDTQGVPGTPPVSETILKKIAACDIFCPDVTFVARTLDGKWLPNPNVMVEYGYALRAKSHVAMMPVMNTHYGTPAQLPFDMGHLRHPIQYDIAPGAKDGERRAERKKLADKLEYALREMIKAGVPASTPPAPFAEAPAKRPPAFFFQRGEVLASFGRAGEQDYRFAIDRVVYMRLFPQLDGQPQVGLTRMLAVFNAKRPSPMSNTLSGLVSRNDYGPIIMNAVSGSTMNALTQGFPHGELWGLSAQPFGSAPNHFSFRDDGPEVFQLIHPIQMETLVIATLENYLKVLASEFNLKPPYTLELGITGVRDHYLVLPTGNHGQVDYVGPVRADGINERYTIRAIERVNWDPAISNFFTVLYDSVACSRSERLTDAVIAAHALSPRQ